MADLTQLTRGHKAQWAAIAVVLLTGMEGLMPVARHLPVDPPGVVSACFGQTNLDMPSLKAGERFTTAECQQILLTRLPRYNAYVDRCIHVALPPHRRAALVSFTYNVGPGTLCHSSVARELNAGHVTAGCNALRRYTYSNGHYQMGLARRRAVERRYCLRRD